MRIHSFSRMIAFPFAVGAGYVLYKTITDYHFDHSYILIPLTIILACIYVFHPQINLWWQKKYPPQLDKPIIDWLNLYGHYFKSLDRENKLKYLNRLSLLLEAKEFGAMGKKMKDVPEDLKAIVIHQAVDLFFNESQYMLGDYDRIYLYKHPFPSPEKQFLHSVEMHHEDGVVLFSLEQLVPGILNKSFFNIGLYAFAEIFVRLNPHYDYPDFQNDIWEILEKISGITNDQIKAIVGFELKDPLPIAIVYYFEYPSSFQSSAPALYKNIDAIFHQ